MYTHAPNPDTRISQGSLHPLGNNITRPPLSYPNLPTPNSLTHSPSNEQKQQTKAHTQDIHNATPHHPTLPYHHPATKPIPPTIRMATFNIAQTYNPAGIQTLLQVMQIDILITQEPPTTPSKPQQNKQHNRGLDHTTHIIDSTHQKIFISPHLAPRMVHSITIDAGRFVALTFNLDTEYITICGVYDYQHHHKISLRHKYNKTIATISNKFKHTMSF